YADDWQWLWRAQFFPWAQNYSILPAIAYNDRPVGAILITLMYVTCGLDHHCFQVILLLIHAANSILLYAIATRYTARLPALLASLLAATWFSTLIAVGWTAAIFDLFGATL